MGDPSPSRPQPVAPGAVTLREVTAGDRFLIRRWLDAPKVAAWFGSRASAQAIVFGALDSPSAITRMIIAEGVAAGYVQAIDDGSTMHPEVPVGAVRADIVIGDERYRGRGAGTAALRLLIDEIFSTTLAPAVTIQVPIAREAQVRAIEAAGFRWQTLVDDPGLGRSWLLALVRPKV